MSESLDKKREAIRKECIRLKQVCEDYRKEKNLKLYDSALKLLEAKQLELGMLYTIE